MSTLLNINYIAYNRYYMFPLNWRKAIRKYRSTKKVLGLLHVRVCYPLADMRPFRFAQWAVFFSDDA